MAELTIDDLKRQASALRKAGDFAGAANKFRLAIAQSSLDLADLYGTLGGTLREQGDLVAAAAAGDQGFDLDVRFDAPSSYNELNRLVTRILLVPGCLVDPGLLRAYPTLAFVDVPQQLAGLEAKLRRDLAGRRAGDPWAAGDLAVTAALNGHLAEARAAVTRFGSISPPPHASAYVAAYAKTLGALALLKTPYQQLLAEIKTAIESAGQLQSGG